MSKRFKVEHKDYEKPITYVTLFQPPYEDENILSRLKWKSQDVTITEVKQEIEEEKRMVEKETWFTTIR